MGVRVVEIWGGDLTLGASGVGAEAALAACAERIDRARAGVSEDGALLAQRLFDLLPRTQAGRRAADARRFVAQALNQTDETAVPPALVTLPGAIGDEAVDFLAAQKGVDGAYVLADSFLAFSGPDIELANDGRPVSELGQMVVHDLVVKGRGGIGFAGLSHGPPTMGIGEQVACVGENAAVGLMAAAMMADGMVVGSSNVVMAGAAGPYEPAYQGVAVTRAVGALAADEIWEGLSGGMRVAQRLKTAGILTAGVLTLKGRGRVVGPVEADRLLRFGVSEWR